MPSTASHRSTTYVLPSRAMPAEVVCTSAASSAIRASAKVEAGVVDAGGDAHGRAEDPCHAALETEGALEVGGNGTAHAEVGPTRCADQSAEDLTVNVDAARADDVGQKRVAGERRERPAS